jgi:hypothetical protein
MKKSIFALSLSLLFFTADAQIKTPAPSPEGSISQKVGLTEISVSYSRPSAKSRIVFGDLVPYGQIWRTGANAATKIKFGENVKINGQELPAGEYSFYTIPGKEEWTLIFHKNLNHWGTGGDKYNPEDDALRFTTKPKNTTTKTETLTFEIGNLRDDACSIELRWENTSVSFDVQLETDAKVMSAIDEAMKGVSQSTYYQAARYYYDHDKDMNKALEWINKSMEGGNDKFWIIRQKALILAKLGRHQEAIAAAELSIAKAKEAKNTDYVSMNEKSIAEWKKFVK